jgi:MoxR-like ATPase
VTPEDVKECAVAVLSHRLVLKPETWTSGVSGVQVVTDLLGKVPGPPSS